MARASRRNFSASSPPNLSAMGNLDRHDPIKLHVAGFPYRAEGTGSEALDQLEMPQDLAGTKRRRIGWARAGHGGRRNDLAAARGALEVGKRLAVAHRRTAAAMRTTDAQGLGRWRRNRLERLVQRFIPRFLFLVRQSHAPPITPQSAAVKGLLPAHQDHFRGFIAGCRRQDEGHQRHGFQVHHQRPPIAATDSHLRIALKNVDRHRNRPMP